MAECVGRKGIERKGYRYSISVAGRVEKFTMNGIECHIVHCTFCTVRKWCKWYNKFNCSGTPTLYTRAHTFMFNKFACIELNLYIFEWLNSAYHYDKDGEFYSKKFLKYGANRSQTVYCWLNLGIIDIWHRWYQRIWQIYSEN